MQFDSLTHPSVLSEVPQGTETLISNNNTHFDGREVWASGSDHFVRITPTTRHPLLLYYQGIPPLFEAEFTVYFHLNRTVPIVFSVVVFCMTLVIILATGSTVSIVSFCFLAIIWLVLAVVIGGMVFLRIRLKQYLNTFVGPQRTASLLLAGNVFSVADTDERATIRRNALLHEVCIMISLQIAAFAATATVNGKASMQDASDYYASSFQADSIILPVILLSVGLCPIRITRYIPNLLLMNAQFFLTRPLPSFPVIVWGYLWSQVLLCGSLSVMAIATTYFVERWRREEFETVLRLHSEMMHADGLRAKALTMSSANFPFDLSPAVVRGSGPKDVAWERPDAVCVAVTLENIAPWSRYRPSVDSVLLGRSLTSAVELCAQRSRAVCFCQDANVTVVVPHSWLVYIVYSHKGHGVAATTASLVETAIAAADELCSHLADLIKQSYSGQWNRNNPVHMLDKYVEAPSVTGKPAMAHLLAARVGITIGHVAAVFSFGTGALLIDGSAVNEALDVATLPSFDKTASSRLSSLTVSEAVFGLCTVPKVPNIGATRGPRAGTTTGLSVFSAEVTISPGPAGIDDPLNVLLERSARTITVFVAHEVNHLSDQTAAKSPGMRCSLLPHEAGNPLLPPPSHQIDPSSHSLSDEGEEVRSNSDDEGVPPNDATQRIASRIEIVTEYFVLKKFADPSIEAEFANFTPVADSGLRHSLWMWLVGLVISLALGGVLLVSDVFTTTAQSGNAYGPAVWISIECIVSLLFLVAHVAMYVNAVRLDNPITNLGIRYLNMGGIVLFVACYFLTIITSPPHNVVSNGRMPWIFLIDFFLMLRPHRRSVLRMLVLESIVMVAFIVDSVIQTDSPSTSKHASYTMMNIATAVISFGYKAAMRVQRDATQREHFIVVAWLSLLDEELQRESDTITTLLRGMAPRGIVAEILRRSRHKYSHCFDQLLHPDRSTQFSTSCDDVEQITVRLLLPPCALDNSGNVLKHRFALQRTAESFLRSLIRLEMLPLDLVASSLGWITMAVSRNGSVTASEEHLASLFPSLPLILRTLALQPCFAHATIVMSSSVAIGAIVGDERPSFGFYGPLSATVRQLAESLESGSIIATSRFVRRCEGIVGSEHLQSLQRYFTGPFEARLRGLPPIVYHCFMLDPPTSKDLDNLGVDYRRTC